MTAPEYLLEAIDIVKVFGTLRANDGVTLQVAPGQIHALLGENGAGKSTLVKMIYGSLHPTSGNDQVEGPGSGHSQSQCGAQAWHRHGVPALLTV